MLYTPEYSLLEIKIEIKIALKKVFNMFNTGEVYRLYRCRWFYSLRALPAAQWQCKVHSIHFDSGATERRTMTLSRVFPPWIEVEGRKVEGRGGSKTEGSWMWWLETSLSASVTGG
jgi:hypothetical protein